MISKITLNGALFCKYWEKVDGLLVWYGDDSTVILFDDENEFEIDFLDHKESTHFVKGDKLTHQNINQYIDSLIQDYDKTKEDLNAMEEDHFDRLKQDLEFDIVEY